MRTIKDVTIIQCLAIVCMTGLCAMTLALHADEKLATILISAFAMALSQLIVRAKVDNASGSGDGSGFSMRAPPMIVTKDDQNQNRKSVFGFLGRLLTASFVVTCACCLIFCNQPASTTANEVQGGVQVAKGVCTLVAIEDPDVSLVCPLLDKKDDAGSPQMMRIKVPRATWERMNEPDAGK